MTISRLNQIRQRYSTRTNDPAYADIGYLLEVINEQGDELQKQTDEISALELQIQQLEQPVKIQRMNAAMAVNLNDQT